MSQSEGTTGRGAAERTIANNLTDEQLREMGAEHLIDEDDGVEATHADDKESEGKWERYNG